MDLLRNKKGENMKKTTVVAIILLLALMATPLLPIGSSYSAHAESLIGPYDLVVSPTGNDEAAGTLNAPLKTVQKAKEKLKDLKGTLPEGQRVNVYLRGGRYELINAKEHPSVCGETGMKPPASSAASVFCNETRSERDCCRRRNTD